MKGIGPHNPKYLRMLDIVGGVLALGGFAAVVTWEYDHNTNDMLSVSVFLG